MMHLSALTLERLVRGDVLASAERHLASCEGCAAALREEARLELALHQHFRERRCGTSPTVLFAQVEPPAPEVETGSADVEPDAVEVEAGSADVEPDAVEVEASADLLESGSAEVEGRSPGVAAFSPAVSPADVASRAGAPRSHANPSSRAARPLAGVAGLLTAVAVAAVLFWAKVPTRFAAALPLGDAPCAGFLLDAGEPTALAPVLFADAPALGGDLRHGTP